MNDPQAKFACPTCERAILNRKINRCLYCGATLPAELLFTKEQVAELDDREQAERQRMKRGYAGQAGYTSNEGSDVGAVIDIVSGLGDLL